MCAYIVNDDGRAVVTKGATAPMLSRVDFGRQHDVYRLARNGDRQAQRWWNDFAADDPDSARLVESYDATVKAEQYTARDVVDEMLTKAEAAPRAPKPKRLKTTFKDELRDQAREDPDPRVRLTAQRLLAEL